MNIRTKILLLLLVLTVGSLSAYFFVAQKVFKEDKVAYVYDSALNTSQTIALLLQREFLSVIDQTQMILRHQGETAPANSAVEFLAVGGLVQNQIEWKKIFENGRQFRMEDWSQTMQQTLAGNQDLQLISWGSEHFVLLIKNKVEAGSVPQGTLIVLQKKFFLHFLNQAGFLSAEVVSNDGASVLGKAPEDLNPADWQNELKNKIQSSQGALSSLINIDKKDFLLSATPVGIANLWVVSFIPQKVAFRSLNLLQEKSIYFVLLLIALTIFLSFMSSRVITQNLEKLLEATAQLTKGDFQFELKIPGRDEFGRLAEAFGKMSREISRLLHETVEKTRMESELKTAQAVQQTLFPEKEDLRNQQVELSGFYSSASECGGDWWFYFERNDCLYVVVADATGHGASAALITAAARSIFTLFEKQKLSLEEMTTSFNEAIRLTSKGQVLMTAMLVEVDFTNKKLSYINCSHEPLIRAMDGDLEYLMEPNNPRIGQQAMTEYHRGQIPIESKNLFFLYTDGFTNQTNADEKDFGDRRLAKCLSKFLSTTDGNAALSCRELNKKMMEAWETFRQQAPQDDDVTMVSFRVL
jgi:sigma-B regulation protein RsbU (phosphoserine phosphatase)